MKYLVNYTFDGEGSVEIEANTPEEAKRKRNHHPRHL